jgi:peptidoglycan hydrolase CwlO-like protein
VKHVTSQNLCSWMENKLASIEKELQHVKKDNTTLARHINARRNKEEDRRKEARKKAEEEAHKKAEEDQTSKDVWTWRK